MLKRFIFTLCIGWACCVFAQDENASRSIYNTIYEYCMHDLHAGRLHTNKRLHEFVTWEEESGWDHFVAIEQFSLGDIQIEGQSAIVPVAYTVVATVDGSTLTKQLPTQKVVTFHVIKTASGWRITRPTIPPHVSLAYIDTTKLDIKQH